MSGRAFVAGISMLSGVQECADLLEFFGSTRPNYQNMSQNLANLHISYADRNQICTFLATHEHAASGGELAN